MIIVDIVNVEDTFYCLFEEYNGIFQFCEEKKKLELEVMFPDQKMNFRLYSKMIVYEDKIVCIPDFASEVALYDLQSKQLKMLPIKSPRIQDPFYDGQHKFLDACLYEDYILMISAKYPAMARIDMCTYKIEYFDEWVNEMCSMDRYKEPSRLFFRRCGAIADGCIYLAGNCAPVCLKLELCTMHYFWIPIRTKEYKVFNDCFTYGNKIWFMPSFHDSVIELDIRQNICSEYLLSGDFYKNGKVILCEAGLLGNTLFLFYQSEDKVVLFNVETKKVEKIIFIGAEIVDECKCYGRYKFVRAINNHIVAYSRALDRVVILNQDGGYKLWKLEFGPKYLFSLFSNQETVLEQERYQLKNFVEYIGD